MVRYVFLIALITAPIQASAFCQSVGDNVATCDGKLVPTTNGLTPEGRPVIGYTAPSPTMSNDNSWPTAATNDDNTSSTYKNHTDSNPHYADRNDPWNH